MMDGAATAAGFYLGIVDDVSPKLRKLRREYAGFIDEILASNAKVQKSIGKSKTLAQQSATAAAAGSAFSSSTPAPAKQKFQLSLEPKRGIGLIRKLFPSAREYMQRFVGRLVPLAKGGMVKDPTAALIGEGGQPEAVIPLNKMQGFFSRVLSKAVTDAGKMSGLAGGSLGKSSNVRDIIVSFTKGEKQLRNMVKFIGDGMKSGRTAAQDAHRMAVIVANMRADEFESAHEKARFVKTLKGQLVPAVEKMRKQAKAMNDIFDKNDDLIQRQKENAAQLGILLTAALHNLERGLGAAERLTGTLSNADARREMMQVGGMSRAGVASAQIQFGKISDDLVSSVNLDSVAAGFANAGVRGDKMITDFSMKFGRSIAMLSTARGADEKKLASLSYHLHDRVGMTVDSVNLYNAKLDQLTESNAITADLLVDTAEGSMPLLQGAFKNISTTSKQGFLDSVTAAKAAFSDRFIDFDVNSLMTTLATDLHTRASVASQLNMTEGEIISAMQSGNLDFISKILGQFKTELAGKSGTDLMIAADQLKAKFGDAFSGMSIEMMGSIGNEADAINAKFIENKQVMADSAVSMNTLAASTSAVLGPLGELKNRIMNLADQSGLRTLIVTAQKLDLIGIGQGILGIGMAVVGFGSVIGKFLPGLSSLLTKLPLLGVLFRGAAQTTVQSAGTMGKGFGDMLSRLGTGIGSFVTTVGRGFGAAISGILTGLGTGLLALAPGLAALSAPPVLIGIAAVSVAMLALGAAIWMVGKGLGAAAPFIKATLEGIATLFTAFLPIMQTFSDIIMAQAKGIAVVIDTVLRGVTDSVIQLVTAFSTVNAMNLLAVGPGLAAVGVGFAAFGAGLAAGLAALTVGNLVDKLGSLFGLSPGTGVLGALGQLTAYIGPLATAFSKLASLPSVISLPQIKAPDNYPTEVMSATMQAMPNLREAAEHAQYIQQSVGSCDDEMKDLMRSMLAVLQTIASNGKSRPGGLTGELVAGGLG